MALFEAVRRGYNLEDAPDSEKLFSSRFPSLLIARRIKARIAYSGVANFNSLFGIATHSLGYYPAYFAFESDDDVNYRPSSDIYVDENNVWVEKTASTGEKWFFIYIFARPILEEYKAPVVASSGVGTDRPRGPRISIARQGNSVDSRDKRDFILNPDTKTMPVHMTGSIRSIFTVPPPSSEWPRVNHDLGYPPLFFIYLIRENIGSPSDGIAQHIWFLPSTDSPFTINANNSTFVIPTNTSGTHGYLVMKDPIL